MVEKNKTKIMMVIRSLTFGWWTEKVCSSLWDNLSSEWYDVSYFLYYKNKQDYNHKWKEICLDKKSKNIISKIFFCVVWAIKLLKTCKDNNIDIMIAFMWSWILTSLLSKMIWNKSKLYITIHRCLQDFPRWIVNTLIFFSKRYADRIVVLTWVEKNNLVEKYNFDSNRIVVIPNYIDYEEIVALSNLPIKDYKDLFNDKRFTFITIGRLEKIKYQELIIQAFNLLNEKYKNIKLVIIWEWKQRDLLKKISNNNTYFLWNQKNIFNYLRKSDCFILTSFSESFSLAIVEAMACGLPIISTKTQWPKDILSNGKYWRLINHNKYDLYKEMEKFLSDEKWKKFYSKKSFEWIEKYQKNNIMKLWNNILNQ